MDWKSRFFTDARKRLASIPFLRNLVEYTKGQSDSDFDTLTSLLHWKPNSKGILQSDLDDIYVRIIGQGGKFNKNIESVMDTLQATADACLIDSGSSTAKIESKVVLSIAIRVVAEEFMVDKIDDEVFWNDLDTNQLFAFEEIR